MAPTRGLDRAVGYQVYVRSFADGNGDGVGDLPGLCARLDYLAWLGVDLVWTTPFYASPMADFGYDVADYTAVDPLFGTLADADVLFARADDLGLRVLLDLVPNHTSDRHPWFVDALRGRDAAHRDWYLWADPAPDGGPPNDWVSHFGGPAWTLDPRSGQYYLHLFLPQQPDLNWRNPAVVEAFDAVLAFWLERGAAGFRVDVAHGLTKDPLLRSNPLREPITPDMGGRRVFAAYDHVHDLDQPDNTAILAGFRRVADRFGAILVGEVYLRDPARVRRYVGDGLLHLAHYFAPLHVPWDAASLRDVLAAGAASLGAASGWVQASHDDPRPATRFGGGRRGAERALALAGVMAGLPGTPFLYQGEEAGLEQSDLAEEALADPAAVRSGGRDTGRDGSRTPIPWDAGPGRGFTAGTPWLPLAAGPGLLEQRRDPTSILHRYRALIATRHALPDLVDVPVTWLDVDGIVGFRRGSLTVAANAGVAPVPLAALGARPPLAWASGPCPDGMLAPDTAVMAVDGGPAGGR